MRNPCPLWYADQRVAAVSAGYYHSLAISTSGRLFSWACGNFGGLNDGQLGLGTLREGTDPEEVIIEELADDETVVAARTGFYHTAVLTSAGRAFTFGVGATLNKKQSISLPKITNIYLFSAAQQLRPAWKGRVGTRDRAAPPAGWRRRALQRPATETS